MSRKPTRAAQLGVTDDDYHRMLEQQDGHCAICTATPKTRRFSVDHDHKTGRVRGLLCHRCNRSLPAWMRPAWLRAAADYLEHANTAPATLDNSTAVVLAPPTTAQHRGLTTG